ncbi:MAG: hypothetical protein FJ319_09875 [SAR202 cluster bacterium]|nr:hypothetical protein [SAR202 cluster bacterium]
MLDDGVAGLLAIRKCGGVTIAQDPEDALFSEMPRNAVDRVRPDYVASTADIGDIIIKVVAEESPEPPHVPEYLSMEANMSENGSFDIEKVSQLGSLTSPDCPDCGGTLTRVEKDGLNRYRCHVGHSFTADYLLEGMGERLEHSLWAAIRGFEERAALLESMAEKAASQGRKRSADFHMKGAEEAQSHAKVLGAMLNAGWLRTSESDQSGGGSGPGRG